MNVQVTVQVLVRNIQTVATLKVHSHATVVLDLQKNNLHVKVDACHSSSISSSSISSNRSSSSSSCTSGSRRSSSCSSRDLKFYLCLPNFCELWNLFSMRNYSGCYFRQLFTSWASRECKKDCKILKIILVPDFLLSTKTEIAQFSIRFYLHATLYFSSSDVNECDSDDVCPLHMKCINTFGSYTCDCTSGKEYNAVDKTCIGNWKASLRVAYTFYIVYKCL